MPRRRPRLAKHTDSLSTTIAAIPLVEFGDGPSLFLSLVRSDSIPAQVGPGVCVKVIFLSYQWAST
jgi:hypothetical protein